jgi:hypothetical protein
MLTTLGPSPIVIVMRHARPIFLASWMNTRPRRRVESQKIRRVEGRWVIQERRWLPVSALDSALQVPEPEVIESYRDSLSPPDWTTRSLCAKMPIWESDPLFHGVEIREAPALLIAATNTARLICARCPVAVLCLTDALINDERYGVWGGTSGRQREKLRGRLAAGETVAKLVDECLPVRELTA